MSWLNVYDPGNLIGARSINGDIHLLSNESSRIAFSNSRLMLSRVVLLAISFLATLCTITLQLQAQHHDSRKNAGKQQNKAKDDPHSLNTSTHRLKEVTQVEPQPLLAQAIRINQALRFIGSALHADDERQLISLQQHKPSTSTVKTIQQILDPYCLADVHINPEARVMVTRGPASPILIQGGWTSFLVKVRNEAGATSQLQVESGNALPMFHGSQNATHAPPERRLTLAQSANRFIDIGMYRNRPLEPELSGLPLEYAVVQIYSRDSGRREVNLGFNIGQGTKDLAFRDAMSVLFTIRPAVKVELSVKDEDGKPVMASFIVTDSIERLQTNNYRLNYAQNEYGILTKRLTGIYPLPSRRMAEMDQYPDFYFQPQVYRSDGEHIDLAPGNYKITFGRGPEYITQSIGLKVPAGTRRIKQSFQLKRWIDMKALGWYSADHHIHAAGCSHYESPEEGVAPPAMFRQSLGEGLDMSSVLSWGPGWYKQKQYFTGKLHNLSTSANLIRYDVEVSGFPSSHAGHLVLLNMKEDDYPGTSKIEDWPSWTLPVLDWAKQQGGLTGYAHSGWGLEPLTPTTQLPNYVLPKMDGIGANEFIVAVTQGAVDFYSAGDTPAPWELNMWYHTLNCGFTTRLSGETDFPCIFDERVGMARSYFKSETGLNYDGYISAIKAGRSYVSDGRSHIIDFNVNGISMGVGDSEVKVVSDKQTLAVTARAAAYLSAEQDAESAAIAGRAETDPPYWNTERARIGKSRNVAVELIVNGVAVDTAQIMANGSWSDVRFAYEVKESSWIALRIYPSAHTNPIFVKIDNKPIRVKQSAEWCRAVVDQCWKKKEPNIRPKERTAAAEAYDKARKVYERIRDGAGDQ